MQLSVCVLKTPNSSRGIQLIKRLDSFPLIDLHIVDSIMLNEDNVDQFVDFKVAKKFSRIIYGRPLIPSEVGCALSHLEARKIISSISLGGVILEDDAEILDIDEFYKTSIKFLLKYRDEEILSMYVAPVMQKKLKSNPVTEWFSLRGWTGGAVAYALSSRAASNLVNDYQVYFVADWPPNNLKFYLTSRSLVTHNNASNKSTISQRSEERKGPSILFRLKIFSGIQYFQYIKFFGSIKSYGFKVLRQRVLFYLDRLLPLKVVE